MNNEIAAFLSRRDALSYCDVIDALEHDEGNVEYFSENHGIVFRHRAGTYYISSFGEVGEELKSHLPDAGLADVYGDEAAVFMKDNLGFVMEEPTYLFLYDSSALFEEDDGMIMELDESYIPFIRTYYKTSSDEDLLLAARSHHLFGCLSGSGDLMAFAGFHEEGAMGMLTVLPEYRRMGVGMMLERHLINTAIKEGRKAYCNVFISNKASIALQEKLGLKRARLFSWWIWTED